MGKYRIVSGFYSKIINPIKCKFWKLYFDNMFSVENLNDLKQFLKILK